MSEPEKCQYVVWAGSYLDPPEYCPNDVDPEYGEGEWCTDHLPPEPEEWDPEVDGWLDDDYRFLIEDELEGDIE